MNSKYRVILLITILLIILSFSISTVNYFVSLDSAQKQLKNQSLPLSLDNIYTEIQKHIIEPYLVSSMMANDTFVHDWLLKDENNQERIIKYLESIKNKYGMLSAFLVSEKTKNYYTQDGFIEAINPNNNTNKWYFNFLQNQENHEINIDFNKHISNSLIMFINYKIFDNSYKYIGATGVALKISYIDDMLKLFRQKYGFKVQFFDENGNIVLSEKGENLHTNIDKTNISKEIIDKIISKSTTMIEFKKDNDDYLINTKYITELNLYLSVEAKIDNYTKDVKKILYFNILLSLSITIIISFVVFRIIRTYNNKLESMAFRDPLTDLYNRRYFEDEFLKIIKMHNRTRQECCIAFIDIDNFKDVNDTYGHDIGDLVLKQISNILKNNNREVDLISRWGGEEIVILFLNTDITAAMIITEKLRELIENDAVLRHLTSSGITASFGITAVMSDDNIDSVLNRADKAMYTSKSNGKNIVTVI